MAKAKRDWSKVADEMCSCGHLKTGHAGVIGHGACMNVECPCGKFTWAYFVDENNRKVA